ncbi:hypothetical protein KC19_1G329600 [Ceratodon purpureus]|uniref:Secreted protein n=1 Tax=Ceratodon purpureus TaxID=3225 RepID=A0A8T0JFJ1_CERPU|nr:hypothetical protein KC19_1G329600 [Ceratodon purpureus]
MLQCCILVVSTIFYFKLHCIELCERSFSRNNVRLEIRVLMRFLNYHRPVLHTAKFSFKQALLKYIGKNLHQTFKHLNLTVVMKFRK